MFGSIGQEPTEIIGGDRSPIGPAIGSDRRDQALDFRPIRPHGVAGAPPLGVEMHEKVAQFLILGYSHSHLHLYASGAL